MRLPPDPISPKAGCGWTKSCLVALEMHPTGKSFLCVHRCMRACVRTCVCVCVCVVISCLYLKSERLISVVQRPSTKPFPCKILSRPGSLLASVCPKHMVRIHPVYSSQCWTTFIETKRLHSKCLLSTAWDHLGGTHAILLILQVSASLSH